MDLQKKYTVSSFVCNATLVHRSVGSYSPLIGEAVMLLSETPINTSPFAITRVGSTCTDVQLCGLGKYVRTPAKDTLASVVPPSYRALRTCTTSSASNNDMVNYPDSLSQERLFIFTVVIDTTVAGANGFSSDASFETYAKVYINGKRINTASRRTVGGQNWVTCTTNAGTTPATYPSCFYPSSALTYGISQVADMTNPWSGQNSTNTGPSGGIKYSMPVKYDAVNAKSCNNWRTPTSADRRSYLRGGNRLIMLEAKTESRATAAYSAAEVDAHILALSKKWGLVPAYR
jgi:hypothetical protein